MKVTNRTTVLDLFCESASNLASDEKIQLLEAMGIDVDDFHVSVFVQDKKSSRWHYKTLREYVGG